MHLNSVQHNNILDLLKSKVFADDKINVTQKVNVNEWKARKHFA